jgi:predicted aminopeptidase
MWETGLAGGHGGRSGERRRRVWRCEMREQASTTRYETTRKKVNSLETLVLQSKKLKRLLTRMASRERRGCSKSFLSI